MREHRRNVYWKVMKGLELYPLSARSRVAASVCRELFGLRVCGLLANPEG